MTEQAPQIPGTSSTLEQLSTRTNRTHRLLLKGEARDLPVFTIPVKYLFFNIENGRYADRMIRIRAENPGVSIDPRIPKWRSTIGDMLLAKGTKKDERDKAASERLKKDMEEKHIQLTPGIVSADGGVLDGNRRLAVIMDLGWEHFDGVILPPDTSAEDKWRIEAGIQMGRPLVHAYSPVNELLKIREGLDLFRRLKKAGQDPAPGKAPEELVAETLYGVDPDDVKESIDRIELIDLYLEFIGKPGRYDLVGTRAERFKEALKIVKAAENQAMDPEDKAKLKGYLFQQILEENLENWDLRKIYQAIGGDRSARGRRPGPLPKSNKMLFQGLPDVEKVQALAKEAAAVRDTDGTSGPPVAITPEAENAIKDLNTFGTELVRHVDEEKRGNEPLRLLKDIQGSLRDIADDKVKMLSTDNRESAQRALVEIKKSVEELLTLFGPNS